MTSGRDREYRTSLHVVAGAAILLLFAWLSTFGLSHNRVLVYPADRAYADLAIARNVLESGFIGAGDERFPAQHDGLWQLLLAGAARAGVPLIAAPQIVGLLVSVIGLLAVLALVRAIQPHAAWSWWTAAAWALTLPVTLDAFEGSSAGAAAALATMGIAASARGIASGRSPLPLSAACWIAISALFRIELLALWIALGLLAVLLSITRRIETGLPTVLVRWINGGIAAAIVLAPILWWNKLAIGVPWPPAPDAAMTANAISAGASIGGALGIGFATGMQTVFGGPMWSSTLTRLFVLGGIAWLAVDLARRRVGWSASILFAGALVPPAFALLYPVLGGEALPYLMRATQPLWLLVAGYAVLRSAELIRDAIQKNAPALSPKAIFLSALVLIGAIPVLAGMREQVVALREQRAAKQRQHEVRAALAERLGQPAQAAGGIASDEPGWLLFQRYSNVADLSGRLHPVVLNWIRGGRVTGELELRGYLSKREVRSAVIWQDPKNRFGALFDCARDADEGPWVCRFTPSVIP